MVVFGALSSLFDFATFGLLILVLHSSEVRFRTGWFLESVISASRIVLVIRTRQPFYASRPGRGLLISTILVGVVTLILPATPLGSPLGLGTLSARFLLGLAGILVAYVTTAEVVKRWFFGRDRPWSKDEDSRPFGISGPDPT
jgi:Mg2+-importing ATPase